MVGGALGDASTSKTGLGFIMLQLILGLGRRFNCVLLVLVLMVPSGTLLEVTEKFCLFPILTFCSMGGKFSRQTIIGSSSTSSIFGLFEIWKMFKSEGNWFQAELEEPDEGPANR